MINIITKLADRETEINKVKKKNRARTQWRKIFVHGGALSDIMSKTIEGSVACMLHTIKNDVLKITVDDHGAELKSITGVSDGTEYLFDADPTWWKYSSPVLFPIVGKLVGNKYRVDGKEYSLPGHGFGRISDYTCIREEVDELAFALDWSDKTLEVIAAHDNICKFIHLPVQSGSDKILKSMNRKYTREWYLDRVAAIRRILPDCGITTDIFVGYHSETEEDHQLSLSLMREVGYDSAFMFKYSERPGTYASKHLPDDVPEEVKLRRLNEMIALQNELSAESYRKDVGKTVEVLVEGVSKRSRDQLFGRTQQNKVVVFDRGNHHIGDFVRVNITDSSSATLKGIETPNRHLIFDISR